MRIFRLHRERRKTLTYVPSEFSFRSDEKWAHGSDAKKSNLHDLFPFMEKTFSIEADGKSDGALDTQRASNKILYVSVFFGSHWTEEVKCG